MVPLWYRYGFLPVPTKWHQSIILQHLFVSMWAYTIFWEDYLRVHSFKKLCTISVDGNYPTPLWNEASNTALHYDHEPDPYTSHLHAPFYEDLTY
jgi:hypothetical protein